MLPASNPLSLLHQKCTVALKNKLDEEQKKNKNRVNNELLKESFLSTIHVVALIYIPGAEVCQNPFHELELQFRKHGAHEQ